MPGVLILAGAGLVAAVKFHDAVLNADGIHVGGVPFAVIGLHFCEGLALILRRLLLEHRIELPIEQIRIHGLPHALPIRQSRSLTSLSSNTPASAFFHFRQRLAM